MKLVPEVPKQIKKEKYIPPKPYRTPQDKLDELAKLYNKTKDEKYKHQLYELIKKIVKNIPS